jgi:hypothetical protein
MTIAGLASSYLYTSAKMRISANTKLTHDLFEQQMRAWSSNVDLTGMLCIGMTVQAISYKAYMRISLPVQRLSAEKDGAADTGAFFIPLSK